MACVENIVEPRPKACDKSVGNPIDLRNGAKIETIVDFATSDGLLKVSRSYTSNWGSQTYLPEAVLPGGGVGWSFELGPVIAIDRNFRITPVVDVFLPEGVHYRFQYDAATTTFVPWRSADLDAETRERFTLQYDGVMPPVNAISDNETTWKVIDNLDGTKYSLKSVKNPNPYSTSYERAYASKISYRSGYGWDIERGVHGEAKAVVDSFGRQLKFKWLEAPYETLSNYPIMISEIGTPDGGTLRYSYDPFHKEMVGSKGRYDRMAKVERAEATPGGAPTFHAEAIYHYEDARFPQLLTGMTDGRNERYVTWAYDDQARAILSSHGDGKDRFALEYSEPAGTVWTRTVKNPLGKKSVYSLSKSGNYLLLTNVAGEASANCVTTNTSLSYLNKLVATKTDEEGRIERIDRNLLGLPTKITEAFGTSAARESNYVWRADRQVASVAGPGLTKSFGYDSGGRLTSTTETDTTTHSVPYATNGQTRAWAYSYTAQGLLSSVDGPVAGTGDIVSYTYDADGYLASFTNELGHVTQIASVDANGRPTLIADPNGVVTALSYTPGGDLASVAVDPAGANVVTAFEHDAIGQLTKLTQQDGAEYVYAYDGARRLVSITNASGNVIAYTHDDMGNVLQTKIEDGAASMLYAQRATFDELGRLLTSIGAGNETWTYGYDKVSNLVSITDPRTGVTTQAFNALNEVIQTVDQASDTTSLTRNGEGQVVAYADPRSIVTSYVYNGWREVIQEASPDIGTIVYERNALGLITKKTDARSVVANYSYDLAGRLTGVSYPAASTENVTFTYDSIVGGNHGRGRLTGFTDPSGSTAIVYNSLGLVESEAVTIGASTYTTEYYYAEAGNLWYIVYPSGRRVSYWRGATGDVTSVASRKSSSDPLIDVAVDISWMPYGEAKTMTFANGLSLWRTFDGNYRAEQLSLYDGSAALKARFYGYQDSLNLTNIWDNVNSSEDESYWYSSDNKLQNASGPWGDDIYYYDGSGNRTWNINERAGTTTSERTYYGSADNHLSDVYKDDVLVRAYTYDSAGNIATDIKGGATAAYTHNNAGRLASFTRAAALTGTYSYNARQQLVTRSVTNTLANGVTRYFYDQAGHVIAEYDGVSGSLKREYVWLGDRPIAVIDPSSTGDKTYYIHADHLNRPIAMTNAAKSLVAQFTWLPNGGLHSYSGTVGLDLRFPGQIFQAESGLHYNWHRQYDPTNGRYTQPDPLGLIDGPSRYAYVGNDPMQVIDIYGLTAACPLLPPTGKSGWKAYVGNTIVFHCGFDTFLEDRAPTPENPIAECSYDEIGGLVGRSHKYCGCRGTPDQYPAGDTLNHIFNDTGGVWHEGGPAFLESARKQRDLLISPMSSFIRSSIFGR